MTLFIKKDIYYIFLWQTILKVIVAQYCCKNKRQTGHLNILVLKFCSNDNYVGGILLLVVIHWRV